MRPGPRAADVTSRCRLCGKQAAHYLNHAKMHLCENCFIKYYERKVYKSILKHNMLHGSRKVAVAFSGGKDSLALVKALHKILMEKFPEVELEAVHIDLGIPGYSEESRDLVEKICDNLNVKCHVYDLSAEKGYVIPDFQATPFRRRICGACGTVKRYLMNKIAYKIGADRLATGHNLDDVVEVLFELYLRGSVEEMVRIRPVSWSTHTKLVTKIKPLIELTEKENLYYVLSHKLPILSAKCPLSKNSRALKRKKLMNMIEAEIPGFKHTFYKSHLKRIMPHLRDSIREPTLIECKSCGMPSLSETCSYCKLISKLQKSQITHISNE
ncbi:MAG: ATP-binding protein [Nitrososphaerota archaeon]|nr:ATP-binding protein [Nitrososphaerota archaeon]